ncbi:DNA mismatch repair endonuclease MutL [bacterium]|nr:DNA mismatch repair endonuclease MutL [bacterium]
MAKVRLLEKSVAERIAAGEVVERPASIVKELVENSLDAGATRIIADIKSGGIKSLCITDNGCGMTSDDMALAIQRFATSKITEWNDLASLSTLGFRGEALPSIAAVSRMSIKSCPPGQDGGTELYVEGAGIPLIKPCSCPPGTRIEVSDLFYNTPARLKFLRSPVAEATNIIDLLGRMAVARPNVSFRLTSNGKEVFSFPVGMTTPQRLIKLWKIPNDTLIPIAGENGEMTVDGYIALPFYTRNNRNNQLILLNGRIIKSSNLSQAVQEGFSPLLPRGRFPVCIIRLYMPPDSFDVNVHPNKLEVRFVDTRPVFSLIYNAVATALEDAQADSVNERHLSYSSADAPVFGTPSWQQALLSSKPAGAETAIDNMPASPPPGALGVQPLAASQSARDAEGKNHGLMGIINRIEAVNAHQLALSASEKALARERSSSKGVSDDDEMNSTVVIDAPPPAASELSAYGLLSEDGPSPLSSVPIAPAEPKPVFDGAETIGTRGFNGSDTLGCAETSDSVAQMKTQSQKAFIGTDTMGFAIIEPSSAAKAGGEAASDGKPMAREEGKPYIGASPAKPQSKSGPIISDASAPADGHDAGKKEAEDKHELLPQQELLIAGDYEKMAPSKPRFQLFGQVHNTFIVGLVDGELWIIDQHTAHERVNYERLGNLSPLQSRSQMLLVPEVIELSPATSEYLASAPLELAECGFRVEPFGKNTFQLRAVPSVLSEKKRQSVFRELIEELVSGAVSIKGSVAEVMRERLRAMTSCKAAVKAGDELSRADMLKLVNSMLMVEHSRYCPHGRPTRVKLDQRTLERLFHR